MNQHYSHDVFLSFSFKDQQIAEQIVNHLSSVYGYTCWICTRDVVGGNRYRKLIPKAIKEAQVVVFLQSKDSIASREVPKEIGIAFSEGKEIIPFRLDQAELEDELLYDLYGVDYIDGTTPTFDQRLQELANAIASAIGTPLHYKNSQKQTEKIISTPSVIPKTFFFGRDKVLSQMRDKFEQGERLVILHGIGGIGKTEIAKQYAKQYKDFYDTIIFAVCERSILDLLIAETPFELSPELPRLINDDGTVEDDLSYFRRKLKKIRKLSSERTLIIIDNFDVDDDPLLPDILEGKYHLLITTRCDYSRAYPTVEIGPIESMDELLHIFMRNYRGYEVELQDPDLPELINLVNRHTYTIELLAQHMESSGQTVREMISSLRNEGIFSMSEHVHQYGNETQTAYENLLKMFNIFMLNPDEQRVLGLLSLMPISGVSVRDFRLWAELPSSRILIALENKGWIVRFAGGIALHPIIRDVIRCKLPMTVEKAAGFIQNFANTIQEEKMWHASYAVKEAYSIIASEVLKTFNEITDQTIIMYQNIENLFSFSVRPKEAVDLAVRIYLYYGSRYGKDTYYAGGAAFKVGWAYQFNQQLENSLENAKKWLEKACEILSRIELMNVDENEMYAHSLVNLSGLYRRLSILHNDMEYISRAKKSAETAVAINRQWVKPGDPLYSRLAGAYMELAEVCIAQKEFDQAQTYIDEAYHILHFLYGEQDPDTIYALTLKARVLYHTKQHQEAILLTQENLSNLSQFYPESHISRYREILFLLKCYCSQHQNEKAREIQRYALKIGETLFGKDSAQLQEIRDMI